MQEATREVLSLPASDSTDVLTTVLREGAQRMLAQAIEAEVESYLGERSGLTNAAGHRQVVGESTFGFRRRPRRPMRNRSKVG